MKKITFLAAALFSVAVFAQELSSVSDKEFSVINTNPKAAVLFDQQPDGTSGIVSDFYNLTGSPVYSTDDFELGDDSTIQTITFYGFQNSLNLETLITGFDLYIYEDNNGFPASDPTQPGTGVLELVDLAIDDDVVALDTTDYFFTINITSANGGNEFTLPAGTYWIVAAPRVNVDFSDPNSGGDRWNWRQSIDGNGAEAHLIDPDDLFGAGATSWTSFSALGLSFTSTAFTIEGEVSLSVNDQLSSQLSLYPNPVSDELRVGLPSSIEVESAIFYDVLGKQTELILKNGSINTSSLSSGVYILKLTTTEGVVNRKVVKK
ncbi:hypothetical protein GCM10009117_22990 [Gangjinia marincola]|uniref:Secretion system C-terminal sorting domain-containing protein n=1 Tax=Gangjinia marincola TaxID=578463 RepID=A0ABP3Y083_9FLAO